jgi:hypothetical protein
VRPYRRDGYEHRVRVHVRMRPATYEGLQVVARSVEMSVSHFMDVLGLIALEEGGEWLAERMRSRVAAGIDEARKKRGFTR